MNAIKTVLSLLLFIALAGCGATERPASNSRNGSSSLLSTSPGVEDPDFNEETFNEEFNSEFGGDSQLVNGEPNTAQQLMGYEAYRDLISFSEVLPTSVNRITGSTTAIRVVFAADPTLQVGIRWFFNGSLLDVTGIAIGIANTSEANEGLYTIEVYVTEANGTEVPIYRASCAMFVFPAPAPPPVAPGI